MLRFTYEKLKFQVETIGDGYLCVSGLPKRNGNEHAREIANMALGFIKSLSTFRIAQMPDERINIRVGIHTGTLTACDFCIILQRNEKEHKNK